LLEESLRSNFDVDNKPMPSLMISVPSSTGSVKENQREKREESPAMFAKFIRERE